MTTETTKLKGAITKMADIDQDRRDYLTAKYGLDYAPSPETPL